MNSRRMRRAGHVACMAEWRGVYGILVGKPEGTLSHLGDPGVNGRIILRWISGNVIRGYGLDRAGSG